MSVNQELLFEIKNFAEQYYLENGVSPSVRDIATGLNVGKSTVQRYLERLRDAGEIDYDGRRGIKTSLTEKFDVEMTNVAKVGSISCGPLNFAQQNITEYYKLPVALVGQGDFFILEADGDSMINAGINNGDLVLIKKQNTALEGQIVVAIYGDDATLKRFYMDKKNSRFILHPENDNYDDIIVEGELYIQGIAVKVIKDLI